MKLCANEDIVYVHPTQYPDIILRKERLGVFEREGIWTEKVAEFTPYRIWIEDKPTGMVFEVRFDDLLKGDEV